MITHTLRALGPALLALTATALPAGAQLAGGPLDFDLLRITDAGDPAHPGTTYVYQPVGTLDAEATGVTVADFNADGYDDMLLCGTEGRANHLYVNNQDGTFTEAAAAHGVDEPAKRRGNSLFFDYDNDGDLDLLTCGYPIVPAQNLDLYSFFRNDGANASYTFTDVTAGVGGFVLGPTVETTTRGYPGGAAVADYDNDGWLDVVVTYWNRNNSTVGYASDQFRLWRNVPNPAPDLGQPDYSPRLFEDVTAAAGLDGAGDEGWIWMPAWVDFDRDGDLDFYLAVEHDEDELRLNNGDGTFGPSIATGIGLNYNPPAWGNEMGVSLFDFDNDGDLDCYLTNPGGISPFTKDAFYRNESDLSVGGAGLQFTYIGASTTVSSLSPGVGWGVVCEDFDNDGDADLLSARGLGFGTSLNTLWRNLYPATAGTHGATAFEKLNAFLTAPKSVGPTMDVARGMTSFDFDNDGDIDVAMTRSGNSPPLPGDLMDVTLYVNTLGNSNNWIDVSLVGPNGSLNTVGARVFVARGGLGGEVQMKESRVGSSFLAQESARLHFGLGADTADSVAVRWFDGTHSVVTDAGGPLGNAVTLAHGGDATGDLDGDLDTDCDDLGLLVTSFVSEAAVDAAAPAGWPWRVLADVDGNGLRDTRDFAALRALIGGPSCDIGNGLAGISGVPQLSVTGTLVGGSPVNVDLVSARPSSSVWILVGFDILASAPFYGGTLVPTIDLDPLGPFPTNGAGELLIPALWPAGLPAGFLINMQYWVQDAAAIQGFAASNAVSLLMP